MKNLIINAILDNEKIANITEVLDYISNPDNDMSKIATIDHITNKIKMKAIECCMCRRFFVACNYRISLDTRDSSLCYCNECDFNIPHRYRVKIDMEYFFNKPDERIIIYKN